MHFCTPLRFGQATAYWHCLRFNEQRVPAGKKLLRMNLDETSISMAPALSSGLIVSRDAHRVRSFVCPGDTRTNVTYVALVCDDRDMQKHMPHIIISSKPQMANEIHEHLQSHPEPNVHVWRNQQKAWNNSFLMLRILDQIKNSVAHRPDIQPMLLLDTASCHLDAAVMRKAQAAGIWLVYIPARMTSLLQPLDTHGFSSFKAWLKRQFADLQSASKDGMVRRLDWFTVLQSAKMHFFDERTWVSSFRETGASRPIVRFTKALGKYLTPDIARGAYNLEPSEHQLTPLWPSSRKMTYAHALLFRAPAPSTQPRGRPAKRPVPALGISIALASRSLKRACRQQPSRDVD